MKNIFVILILFICKMGSSQTKKSIELLDFKDGNFSFCQELSKEEFSTLIKEAKLIEEYKKKFGRDVYVAVDGSLLDNIDSSYTKFHSEKDFLQFLAERNHGTTSQEIMYKKNIYGKDFPSHVHELIEEFLKINNVSPNAKLDKELLQIIEKNISAHANPFYMYRKYFVNIVALLGQILINHYGGVWKMTLSDDKVTWNPSIVIKQKATPITQFGTLYEVIFYEKNIEDPLQSLAIGLDNDDL